jgi:protein tyrosine/serine phosphatase
MKDLEQMGIRSIINLRMKDSDNRKVAATGLNHIHLPMKAQSVTYEDVVRTMKAIRDAPQPVLIHCRRGSDRTGCMVAFYRIVFLDWSKEKAIEAFLDPKYGYLENLFPNLVELIEQTNIDQLKKDIEL